MAWAGGEQDGGVMILATPGREEMVAGEAAQRCLELEAAWVKAGTIMRTSRTDSVPPHTGP